MSSKAPKPFKKDELRLVDAVLDRARSIRTPIQLISFFLAIVLAIVLLNATPAANVLV